MDTTTIISDLLDNQNLDSSLFGELSQMAEDYQHQLLMLQFQEELNS